MLVYCGQTVGWIRMPLGMELGLVPGHIVLHEGQPSPRKKDTPIFSPCLLWPNGWMDQDATWYEGRPRPRPQCVRFRWGSALTKRSTAAPPFWAHVYCGQAAGCIRIPLGTEVGLGPGHTVLDGDPVPHGMGHSSPPPALFGPLCSGPARSPISATAELLLR